jgi:hypothetical protein
MALCRKLKASAASEVNVDGIKLALESGRHIMDMANLLLNKKAWLKKNMPKPTNGPHPKVIGVDPR